MYLMNTTKKFFIVITLSFLFLALPNTVYAEGGVDHIAGKFERLQERIRLVFKFNKQAKADYKQELLEKRLEELDFVSENEMYYYFEDASYRYAAYAGRVTSYTVDNNLVDRKKATLELFKNHKEKLEIILARHEYDSAYWLLTMHDINSLDSLSNTLKDL